MVDGLPAAISARQFIYPTLRLHRYQAIVLTFKMFDNKPGRLQRQKHLAVLFGAGVGLVDHRVLCLVLLGARVEALARLSRQISKAFEADDWSQSTDHQFATPAQSKVCKRGSQMRCA